MWERRAEEMLTAERLVELFEARLAKIERADDESARGEEPSYPFMVLFLGEESAKNCPGIAARIASLWPQYASDMALVSVNKMEANGGFEYVQYVFDGQAAFSGESCSPENVSKAVTKLFSATGGHFKNRSSLFVYCVFDTSAAASASECKEWIDALPAIRDELGLNILDPRTMLFTFVDESPAHHSVSSDIRKYFSGPDLVAGEDGLSVLLLSNRLYDNSFLDDWSSCHNIVVACMALSNSGDSHVRAVLFSRGFETVGYARMEKPTRAIGTVVVSTLLSWLARSSGEVPHDLLDDPELPARLGITKDGTVAVLDEYVNVHLAKTRLPKLEQLTSFPRRTMDDHGDISKMSFAAFDAMTMGAWRAFIDGIIADDIEGAKQSYQLNNAWREAYAKSLHQEFSLRELIYLADNKDKLRSLFGASKAWDGYGPVLTASVDLLRYQLSSQSEVIELLLDELERQGENAKVFVSAWDALVQSRLALHDVDDYDTRTRYVSEFYKHTMQDFIDRKGNEVGSTFEILGRVDELASFFEGLIDQVIEFDSVFTSSFEVELKKRLEYSSNAEDTQKTIREILSGSGIVTYLRTVSPLGLESLSAMLYRKGSKLQQYMTNVLPEDTFFYNTGQGYAAETLRVYRIESTNLAI